MSLLDKLTLIIKLTEHIKMATHTIIGKISPAVSSKWFSDAKINWWYFEVSLFVRADFWLLKILA